MKNEKREPRVKRVFWVNIAESKTTYERKLVSLERRLPISSTADRELTILVMEFQREVHDLTNAYQVSCKRIGTFNEKTQ